MKFAVSYSAWHAILFFFKINLRDFDRSALNRKNDEEIGRKIERGYNYNYNTTI